MSILNKLIGNAGTVKSEELTAELGELLVEGETIDIGFRVMRDTFAFTNKRLIIVDKQGITGKKIEYLTIGYKSISRFSIETNGTFDLDAELKIWISSEQNPSVVKKFNKKVNIYDVSKALTTYTC